MGQARAEPVKRPGEAQARAPVEAAAKGSAEKVRINGRAGATEPALAQSETARTDGSAVGTDRVEVIERVEVGVIDWPRARPGGNTRLPWCARGGGVWLERGPG